MREIRQGRTVERLESELASLRAAEQFRDLWTVPGIQLCSNDYLGLSSHPALKRAIAEAVDEDPRVASTGSRLLSGNAERWDRLEAMFAAFLGVEAALYFPSGYAANIGLLSSVLRPEDTIFSDSANHASLIDGIRLSRSRCVIFPHLDLNYLEDSFKRAHGPGEKFVVVESLFSMDGDRAPLKPLMQLCERYDGALIVDEAHATGVDGDGGRGMVHAAGRGESVFATVHTCGKALAAMGAFVAGSHTLRNFLINRARTFIFTTGLPPYCAAHVEASVKVARDADQERRSLTKLSEHMRHRLHEAGIDTGNSDSQIIPVILGENEAALRVAECLRVAGFAIRAIRPPSVPRGTARLRISLTANLSIEDIDRFADLLSSAREGRKSRG